MADPAELIARGLKSAVHYMQNCGVDAFIAGWHARGRAERVTKAERAVIEAAQRCHDRDFRDGVIDLVKKLNNLERAKGRK